MTRYSGPAAAYDLAATVDRYWMAQKGLTHGSLYSSWSGRDWCSLWRWMAAEFSAALHPVATLEVVEAVDSKHPTNLILTREADGLEIVLGVELNSRLYRLTDHSGRVVAFALLGRERPNPVFPMARALADLLATADTCDHDEGATVYA